MISRQTKPLNYNNKEKVGIVQFRLFLIFAVVLLLFRLFVNVNDATLYMIVNTALIFTSAAFLFLFFVGFLNEKEFPPLSLVMNVGIVSAITFLLVIFSNSFPSLFIDTLDKQFKNPGFTYELVSYVYIIFWMGISVFTLAVLHHLFFRKQGNNLPVYFNTMIVFILLGSFTPELGGKESYSFISDTFLIVAILLMFVNSLRISWIAFLSKKEKIILLFLSIVISVLFIINASSTGNSSTVAQILFNYSLPLNKFVTLIMIYGAIYFSVLFFTTLFHLPTAAAIDRKIEEVSSLQYFSKLITQVLDFDELAETVSDIALRVSNSDSAWIIWKTGDDVKTVANKNIGILDSNLLNEFILSNVSLDNLNDIKTLNANNFAKKSELGSEVKHLAISPLKAHGKVKGLLAVARHNERKFNEEDKSAIDTFSDYASVAIENSFLLEESIEKERLERELDVAREIQQKILPDKNPEYDELEISSVFIPAFEVGGDYYDFFEISETQLGFIIADVSGKGISAAFIMAEVKGIFQSLSKSIKQPGEILIKANEILKNTLDDKTFVSAAYGLIDLKERKLQLARAGHCPVLLLRDETVQTLKPAGLGLGLSKAEYFDENLEQTEITLMENDTIVLYTDGITEAKNENLQDFGEKYFMELLLENYGSKPGEISEKIIKQVTLFSKNHSQYDDITLVILKCNLKIKTNGEREWQSSAHQ